MRRYDGHKAGAMPVRVKYLDKTTIAAVTMTIPDGFPDQRMVVLPRPVVAAALAAPGTRTLTVSDIGYFPAARHHGRHRSTPIDESVLLICTAGSGWCQTPQGRWDVRPAQGVILPAGRPHSYASTIDDPWTLWWIHAAGVAVDDLLTTSGVVDLPVRFLSNPELAVQLANEALQWMDHDLTSASLLGASGAAWHLFTMVALAHGNPGPARLVDQACMHLRSNLNRRLSVSELARQAHLSSSHFAAVFKAQVGCSMLKYHTQLRMTRARELLDTTDLTVGEVGRVVGYDDAFYFTRKFTQTNGIAPRPFRNRIR